MTKKLTPKEAQKAINFIYESNDLQGCFTIARKMEDEVQSGLHFGVPTAAESADMEKQEVKRGDLASFFYQSNLQVNVLFRGMIAIMVGQFSFGNATAENIEEAFNRSNKMRLKDSMKHIEDSVKDLDLKPVQVNQLRQLHNAMCGDYYGSN